MLKLTCSLQNNNKNATLIDSCVNIINNWASFKSDVNTIAFYNNNKAHTHIHTKIILGSFNLIFLWNLVANEPSIELEFTRIHT